MNTHLVIPARLKSTRLPNKPLLKIHGTPMVIQVAKQVSMAEVDSLVVATDSTQIQQLCTANGFEAVLTSESHVSGTDRLAEVASIKGWSDQDVVVNVQGDEPLIPIEVVNQVATLLKNQPECSLATLCEPIETLEDLLNPSVVKAVLSQTNQALYFSRAALPAHRDTLLKGEQTTPDQLKHAYRHIGIYAYRVQALKAFAQWGEGALEHLEALEQLRFLENGHRIAIEPSLSKVPGGVDTQADLDRMNALDPKQFA